MGRPRIAMRKVREILRLVAGEGMSGRQAAAILGVPETTLRECLQRARAAGVSWPLPEGVDDATLEEKLYGHAACGRRGQPAPDWASVHRELRRKGVTLHLLWLEYRERCPDGWGYTQFSTHYKAWSTRTDVVMRQHHVAGEKLFLDFAGPTVPITDPATGVVTQAQLFVAVCGASSYTYVEVVRSQTLPDWCAAHVRALGFFGGSPRLWVPDNLRSAVSRAHRYEPLLNRTYEELATHHGAAIVPARAYKPRDKAKAEAGVLLAERWILARLRHYTFFSLAEANDAVRPLLRALNDHPFQKMSGSRSGLFEELERPALLPLPAVPWEYAQWKAATVNIDYHIEVDGHLYSVPYQLARQRLDIRLTPAMMEAFHRGRRVASHPRSHRERGVTTDTAHMPAAHREQMEWTPSRITAWARRAGPQTAALVEGIMARWVHPELGYRSALGVIRLGRRYGDDRLEAACARAVAIRSFTYRSVESILRTGLDHQPVVLVEPSHVRARDHEYIRGAGYYDGTGHEPSHTGGDTAC
jgi:transposase